MSRRNRKRTCWCCPVSWFRIACNWWIIAFSRLCLSAIVGAAPISDRMLSMTSPLTWHHPTSGSSPFPLPVGGPEYPLTSAAAHPTTTVSDPRLGDRRAGTALRFLADIFPRIRFDWPQIPQIHTVGFDASPYQLDNVWANAWKNALCFVL